MTQLAARFRVLHDTRNRPLVLPNVWDAASARACAAAGFPALATASAAIAASAGCGDGEQMPVGEMLAAVARIAAAVDVPVSADMEAGFGLAPDELVARVLAAGAVGVNLEDSDPATHAVRGVAEHTTWLRAVRRAAGSSLVVNARIDLFLPGRADGSAGEDLAAEAVERARSYAAAGSDVVYPILAPRSALRAVVAAVPCPVNALAAPDPAAVAGLAEIGVRRVTFGPQLLHAALQRVSELVTPLLTT